MKSIKEYIQEKLIINKNSNFLFDVCIPNSLKLDDIKEAWDNLFDDIRLLKTGNIHLGQLKIHSEKSRYKNNKFILYPNYRDKITIRRNDGHGGVLWI